MNAQATNKVNDADAKTALTVSNPWIICRSKSHGGQIYYFNTLTGEAAWNLSDAEIEKAKKATKQLGGKFPPRTRSPETRDIPIMNFRQASINPQNPSPNNSDPKMLFPGFITNSPFSGTPNNLLAVPNSLIGAPINPVNLNNMHSIYNPSIWAVPPSQQIFISSSPIANTSQAPLNVAYNNMQQTLSANNLPASIFTNLEAVNHMNSTQPRQNNFFSNNDYFHAREKNETDRSSFKKNYSHNQPNKPWHNNFKRNNFFQDRHVFKRNVHNDKPDLRQKLAYRRKSTNNPGSPSKGYNFNNRFKNFNITSTVGQNSSDYGTNFKESQEQMYEDSSLRLDLTPLKELAGSDVKSDCWFIVVDANIILNEFKFLITLTDSDPQCHLMVPRSVMSELETYVSNSQDLPARRIVRYLTQQIRVGHVRIGETSDDVEDEPTNAVLSTCSRLLKENYHQIILTSDMNLLRNKHSINVIIFTADELKTLLKPTRTEFHDTKPPTFIPKVLKKNVVTKIDNVECTSITIPNKNIQERDDRVPLKSDDIGEAKSNLRSQKNTVDAGIQTDFTDFKDVSDNTVKDYKQKPKANDPGHPANEPSVGLITNIPPKRREIRLKRTISHPQTLPSESDKKKPFKWRIRRNISTNETSTSTSIPKELVDSEIQSNSCKDETNISDQNLGCLDRTATNTDLSDISSSKQTPKKNITIEETSTSGIISNSISNNDIESISSGVTAAKSFNVNETNLEMASYDTYTVDSYSMHEYLEMKCDEWVSRFTQIMEEVLSQVLQQDPPFMHKNLPPPWTLHEATQCIALRFNNHRDIKVAANKLSNIVFKVSDGKGKISLNMTPTQYMEMYTYGVRLVDALKLVVTDMEDIHVATGSLKELLNDIRHPNLDTSTQEAFNDISIEAATPDVTSIEESISPMRDVTSEKTLLSTPNSSKNKYNLRSQKPIRIQDNEDSGHNVKIPKTVKGLFLSTLNLQRKEDEDLVNIDETPFNNRVPQKVVNSCGNSFMFDKINFTRTLENKIVQANDDQHATKTLQNNLELSERDRDYSNITTERECTTPTKEPKIIRNFGRCVEFEKKLFKKYEEELKAQSTDNFDEDLDYEEEYNTEEYVDEQEYDDRSYDGDSEMAVAEVGNDESNIQEPVNSEDSESYYPDKTIDPRVKTVDDNVKVSDTPVEPDANNNDIDKFKFIVGKVVEEIKEAFHPVQMLCQTYYNECKRPNGFKIKKIQLQAKAKKAQWHIENIINALEGMLGREVNGCNEDISSLMKKAGIEHIDDDLHEEYKYTISKCKSHAEMYLDALKTMISELRC